jgi:hypothetical protein
VRGHAPSARAAQTPEAAEAALAQAGRRLGEAAAFAKGDPAVLVAAGEALVARAELRVAAAAEAAAGAGRRGARLSVGMADLAPAGGACACCDRPACSPLWLRRSSLVCY